MHAFPNDGAVAPSHDDLTRAPDAHLTHHDRAALLAQARRDDEDERRRQNWERREFVRARRRTARWNHCYFHRLNRDRTALDEWVDAQLDWMAEYMRRHSDQGPQAMGEDRP